MAAEGHRPGVMARNTNRAWARRDPDTPRPWTGRPLAWVGHEDWLKARFLAGVRNAEVLRQELADRNLVVSIRTVDRFMSPLRTEALNEERAALRFETEPGQQMQIDFGEMWIEVAGERVKAFLFVATLGYSRTTFAQIYPTPSLHPFFFHDGSQLQMSRSKKLY